MLTKQGFYDINKNENGKGIAHKYEVVIRSGKKLVLDHTTGLTWQQAGSEKYMTYEPANAYVDSLRQVDYGGYSDWRLPTLEEAMSLMESQKHGDLYIDPVFDQIQKWIWTADKFSSSIAWTVGFRPDLCGHPGDFYYRYVRAVR